MQFTQDNRFLTAWNPQFSFDSNWVAFEAVAVGEDNPYKVSVWAARTDGTGLRRMSAPGAGPARSPQWTPAGRLVYVQAPVEEVFPPIADVLEVDLDNPSARRVIHTGEVQHVVFRQPAYWQIGFRTPVPQPIP